MHRKARRLLAAVGRDCLGQRGGRDGEPLQPNAHHSWITTAHHSWIPQCPSHLENNCPSQLDTHCSPQPDIPVPTTAGYPLPTTAGYPSSHHSWIATAHHICTPIPITSGYPMIAGHPQLGAPTPSTSHSLNPKGLWGDAGPVPSTPAGAPDTRPSHGAFPREPRNLHFKINRPWQPESRCCSSAGLSPGARMKQLKCSFQEAVGTPQ